MIPTKLQDKLVLIVEDDPINNELLIFLLKKASMKSISAYNAADAIDLFNTNSSIDLVLMDIKMPGMNGYEATKKMKQIRPNIPIIAQTAYALEGDRKLSLDAGCDEYIKKPIKKEILYELMADLL